MSRPDLFCVEGLLESGVVDFVWGCGFRAPTVDSLCAAQHGIDRSPGMALPDRAVIACFSMQFPDLVRTLAAHHVSGRYVILSRDSDPGALNDDWPACIHHVVSGNAPKATPRLTPIPGAFGPFWQIVDKTVDALRVPRRHTNRVLVSYSIDTPGSVYHAGHERITAIEYFRDKPWATVNENLLGWATRAGPVWPSWRHAEYLALVREHDYLVVPCGYGVDRMAQWEAMALGTIPICKKHPALLHFAETPIAFVDDWTDVTPEWCEANKGAIERSQRLIALSYWVARFRALRAEIGLPEVRV